MRTTGILHLEISAGRVFPTTPRPVFLFQEYWHFGTHRTILQEMV